MIWFRRDDRHRVEIGLLTPALSALSVFYHPLGINGPRPACRRDLSGPFPLFVTMILSLPSFAAFPWIATWLARI